MDGKSKVQRIQDFIVDSLPRMEVCSTEGTNRLEFPDFELFPFDYLEYAEAEIVESDGNDNKRINCISHLKRAIECELDSFMYAMGLNNFIRPGNFPTKMEWLGKMGIFSPRSLRRLNMIRNEMEHSYSIPKVQDLELYFDLASTFVHTLEGFLLLIDRNQVVCWTESGKFSLNNIVFSVSYEYKNAILTYDLGKDKNPEVVSFEPSSKDDFLFAFHNYLLLCRNASDLVDDGFVIKKIQKYPSAIINQFNN